MPVNLTLPPPPIYIFVRQETEEIFTALSLIQPTLDLLTKAIAKKYQVSNNSPSNRFSGISRSSSLNHRKFQPISMLIPT